MIHSFQNIIADEKHTQQEKKEANRFLSVICFVVMVEENLICSSENILKTNYFH